MTAYAKATPIEEPIKLNAVSFIATKTHTAKTFIEWIEMVNERAGGKMKIKFLGGPEVIPAREQVEALRTGVVDISISPIAYHSKIVPACIAWALSKDTPWEERKSGFFEHMSKLYEKANIHLLAEIGKGAEMYFFLNKEIKTLRELRGLKIRTIPTVATLLDKLGCKGVTIPRGDIYVAMERGLIDGFLSPPSLVIDLGQHEVTKCFVDHGFLVSVIVFGVNLDTWNSLPKDMQDLLSQTAEEIERIDYPRYFEIEAKAKERLVELGVKKIEFSPEDIKRFYAIVYESFSADLDRADPKNGSILKRLIIHKVGEGR